MAKKFVHLHAHSHYSLLSALPKIPDFVDTAKEAGFETLALTDNGNLYGAIEFYKECKSAGIKPIIGVDAYVAARRIADKQAGIDNRRSRLILLAKNAVGYKNLLKIVTVSNIDGFYYKPRIDRALAEKYSEGLVAISPFWNGEIAQSVRGGNEEKAHSSAAWAKKTFGKDFYMEITRHSEADKNNFAEAEIRAFAEKEKIPLVAAQEIFYISKDDRRARDTLLSVQNNRDFGEIGVGGEGEFDLAFKTPDEMAVLFKKDEKLLETSAEIADKCNLELKLGTWVFPDYKVKSGLSHDDELRRIVDEGIAKRGLKETPEIKKRIEYELDVIFYKGFSPYFLVVSDLLRHAHEKNILTTIRGSVAGSLVAYLADITNVNPLEYKLPFERFLTKERPGAPDMDMDYADNRRDEMIEYAKEKYGADRVAQVGTFGTMMARGAVRDVARALGFDYAVGDKIAKLIPMGSQGFPMTLERAIEMTPDLADLIKKDRETRDVIAMAKKIEGCARHISVHAAGVVIAPKPLVEVVPLQYDPKSEGQSAENGKIITQYDMHSVEDAGLLKFDFLGIKNLSILSDAVALAKRLEGVEVDIENVPLDDKKTFEMLAAGETAGLFQLNGAGMTRYLKDLKPTSILDINAMVALYRPGPMESIPKYIERKHNTHLISYLDERLKDILDQSFGVITYQDDVLLIAVKLGGYSWLEADKLRKAMGKKIPKEMAAQKEKLIEGFRKHGLDETKSEELWKLIEPFAAYGFNKAHASSYGKVAYQTAYMKANFPAIYMSAVLTADSGDVEKIGEMIPECKRLGIPVLPPDVNESFEGFTVVKSEESSKERKNASGKKEVEKNNSQTFEHSNLRSPDRIRFGLTTIKNFGAGIAAAIITERKRGGKFKSLGDFLDRVKNRNLNKKSLEALIKSGALDELGSTAKTQEGASAVERGAMLANIENLLDYNRERAREAANQSSLFGASASSGDLRLASAPAATQEEKLAWERELLGLYLSGHPLDKFKEKFENREPSIRRVREEYREGMEVVVGGLVEEVKEITTKSNEPMAFARLADFTGSIEVVAFPRTYKESRELIAADKCIAIKGRVSHRNGLPSLVIERVKAL